MERPGRNDRCPCGSGRKFKRCCMGKEEERAAFGRLAEETALPLLSELARFAERAAPGPLETVARQFFPFWTGRLDAIKGARVLDFLIFDFRREGYGRRAIDEFSIERAARLCDAARATLARWSEAAYRLYVVDGWSAGFTACVDAFAGGPAIDVLALRGGASLTPGRPVALRALACGAGALCTGKPLEFGERGADEVREAIRSRHLAYVRTERIAGIDEFFRAQPTAIDEEAAVGGQTSRIIVPGLGR